MNANIRTIGGSVGAAVMASIVTAKLLPDGLPTESGYTAGFAMLAGALLLAALAGLLIPRAARRCATPTSRSRPRCRTRSWRSWPAAPWSATTRSDPAVADTCFAAGVVRAFLESCRHPSLGSAS